jgi:drug/metabolite transporter (DMT)-like permease
VAAELLQSWSPLTLTTARLLVAGIVVGLFAMLIGQSRDMVRLSRSPVMWWAAAALLLSTVLFVIGQKYVDPVAAAVIVSAMPIFSLALGWLQGRERLTVRFGIAIALVVAGGVVTSLVAAPGAAAEPSPWGSLAMLAGVIGYVWYTRLMIDNLNDERDAAKAAVSMVLAGCAASAIVAVLVAAGQLDPAASASPRGLVLLLWLGAIAVGASAVLWFWAGRRIGVTIAAMHHNMVPFYVIVMAALAGAEVTAQHILGAALVIAGAVLAQVPLGRRFRTGVAAP